MHIHNHNMYIPFCFTAMKITNAIQRKMHRIDKTRATTTVKPTVGTEVIDKKFIWTTVEITDLHFVFFPLLSFLFMVQCVAAATGTPGNTAIKLRTNTT